MLHPDDWTKPASRSSRYKAAAVHPIDEEPVSEVHARGYARQVPRQLAGGMVGTWPNV